MSDEIERLCQQLEDAGLVLEGPARRQIAAALRSLDRRVEEARAEGYRAGLEAAAKEADTMAAEESHGFEADALRRAAAAIRSLASREASHE